MGERGYENCMRRSVQTVILFEANRCLQSRLQTLRPFQRKIAFFDQAKALVDQCDLLPHQREEVMWRTGTSKEPMAIETVSLFFLKGSSNLFHFSHILESILSTKKKAWKRMKLIEKELEKLLDKVRPLFREGMSHEECCNEFIQKQFEIVSGNKGNAQAPFNWHHSHNNIIMTYQMYYNGLTLDPTFPAPQLATQIIVPREKPKTDAEGINAQSNPTPNHGHYTVGAAGRKGPPPGSAAGVLSPAEMETTEERRAVLQEVKEHMDLLEKFEGIVDTNVLKKRKRDLFDALPPAPPTISQRIRMRSSLDGVYGAAAAAGRPKTS